MPDDDEQDDESDPPAPAPAAQPTPAQPSSSSSGAARRPPGQRPKQMTLDDLKKTMGDGDGPDEDEDDKNQGMFAGGEKSGLEVQNPGGPVDHFKNIMNQARQNRDRPAGAGEEVEQPQRSSAFTGRAQTLGGDEAESEVIEDPVEAARRRQQQAAAPSRATRTMHLWADGVSIDDGPLFRFDDPANQGIMAEINRGRAPLALLDVQPDQEVDLNLEPHKDEKYVQPKKTYKPFGGQGQRLGSPTPGPGASNSAITTASSTTSQPPAPTTSSSAQQTPSINVDDATPTLQLQIRLGDGTRLQSRFNITHTIGDVYAFVDRAASMQQQRPYALMTTFPSKELDDRSVVLGDMAEFKRGGVVVQKWK